MIVGEGAHDVEQILDEWEKKNELHRVWIKNHNVEARFANIELLLVAILVCEMLLFLPIVVFMSNK